MSTARSLSPDTPGKQRRQRRLGEILLARAALDHDQLQSALGQQRQQPRRRLGEVLLDSGLIDRAGLRAALADKHAITRVDLARAEIDPAAVNHLPAAVARRLRALPIARSGEVLLLAMEDPFDAAAISELAFHCGRAIEPLLAEPAALARALRRYANAEQAHRADAALAALTPATVSDRADGGDAVNDDDSKDKVGGDRPVVKLLGALLTQAVGARASDIHLRPGADGAEVHFRVDGRLLRQRILPSRLLPALINRLKVIARLDIANRLTPQGGQAAVRIDGREIDLRLSVLPTLYGESASLRVLDKSVGLKPVDDIGFGAEDLARLRRLIAARSGMLLVTGPTGAGKSTTLYALLSELCGRGQHLITLEDPVEYRMPGVEQVAVNESAGLGFATALRSVLRHDPDVILVGEIRDQQTASIAARSALTGHLLFSSLHASDAAGAAARLLDLGVAAHLLASTLLGVVAQRLVALNCRYCLRPQKLEHERRTALGLESGLGVYHGAGCERCNDTGISGRQIIYELLPVDDSVRELIQRRADAFSIRRAALAKGMRPLTEHALSLLCDGRIDVEQYAGSPRP